MPAVTGRVDTQVLAVAGSQAGAGCSRDFMQLHLSDEKDGWGRLGHLATEGFGEVGMRVFRAESYLGQGLGQHDEIRAGWQARLQLGQRGEGVGRGTWGREEGDIGALITLAAYVLGGHVPDRSPKLGPLQTDWPASPGYAASGYRTERRK